MTMKGLLVIEDGDEYVEFARLFLADRFRVLVARNLAAAETCLTDDPGISALLIDLRFDRAPPETLTGDVGHTASTLFAGDLVRARRYLEDHQGALILAALRQAGHAQPAVFVHDFPPRRLDNLRRLYGRVDAVPTFDAAALRRALGDV